MPTSDKLMWEILVPTIFNTGKPIRTRQHREWDRRVRRITAGLTILNPVRGQWICPAGKLFIERMIPVRLIASRDEMLKIINMSIDFYEQEAILAYKISDEVLLVHRKDSKS